MFPQIFGKYVLTREIAAGGMARVFLATLRGAGGFEKRLVVKQIRPELASDQSFIGRFVAEAKTTVELSHSNIVPVYELGAEQGTYYIAMEFCEGVSLNQLLADGPLSPVEGAYIGVEICRALDYAHRRAGIVHRDVTPRNVMIDPEGMVRLIDFGIASAANFEATGQGPLFGSPGHMPPEQLRPGPLTPAADVFAVAVLLIETWTGKPPFRRESFEASWEALKQPPPDIAETDTDLSSLSELVASAVSLDPRSRPQSAEELARPLRDFLRQEDLGDIARRLGKRVEARLGMEEAEGAPLTAVTRSGPVTASGATQTFAVRDKLLEWTAKIDSRPPRISRTAPLPQERTSSPNGAEGRIAPSSNAPSFRDAAPASWSERALGPYRITAALGLAVVLVLGSVHLVVRTSGGDWLGGAERTHEAAPLEPLRTTAVEHASALTSTAPAAQTPDRAESLALESLAPSPAATPGPELPPSVPPSQRPLRRQPPHASPGVLAAPVASAHVDLTAEPPALVKMDAAVLGHTPLLNLALPAGQHEFVFVNDLLAERLQASISLVSSERQRVHADFTSATPQVYVR